MGSSVSDEAVEPLNSHNLKEEKREGKSGMGENHVTEAVKGSSAALKYTQKTNSLFSSLLPGHTSCYTPKLLPRVHEYKACCVKPWGASSP